MAGGNFDINVGKTRPGTYVNVRSNKQQKAKGSTRGIALIPFIGYDWGPNGEFIKLSVDSPDASLSKLGRSVYDDNDFMLMVREIFKNSITCYVYVINSGTAATGTIGSDSATMTVTAMYPGTRGNDISLTIVANVLGGFDVSVFMGSEKVEFYEGMKTYADVISAAQNKYVKFESSAPTTELTALASMTLIGGAAITNSTPVGQADGDENSTPAVQNSAVTEFLDKSEKIRWNTMCFPVTDTSLQTVCIAKIKMLRNSVGKYVQAVLPNCTADFEGIINVTNSIVLDDGTVNGKALTIAQACAWVTGVTAGASKTQSNTYVEYTGAIDIVGVKSNEEAVEAIKNGEFFFSRSDEDKIVVEYDINSLHNFTTERTSDYAKNRVVRVYDSFAEDLRLNFPPNKFNNDPDGWLIMEGLGRELLVSYGPVSDGGDGSIMNVDLDKDFYVDQSRSAGDETFFNVGLQAVDSAEKLYFSVSTR